MEEVAGVLDDDQAVAGPEGRCQLGGHVRDPVAPERDGHPGCELGETGAHDTESGNSRPDSQSRLPGAGGTLVGDAPGLLLFGSSLSESAPFAGFGRHFDRRVGGVEA